MISRLVCALLLGLATTTGCGTDPGGEGSSPKVQAEPRTPRCDVPEVGPISVEQLPAGSSAMECDAVGRTVVWRGAGVTVPPPGEGLDIFTEQTRPGSVSGSFGIFVSEDGIVSYEFRDGDVGATGAPERVVRRSASMPRRPEARVLFSGRIAYPHVTISTWGCAPFRIDRVVRVDENLLRVVGRTAGHCRTESRRHETTERLSRSDRVGGQGVARVVLVDRRTGFRIDAEVVPVIA